MSPCNVIEGKENEHPLRNFVKKWKVLIWMVMNTKDIKTSIVELYKRDPAPLQSKSNLKDNNYIEHITLKPSWILWIGFYPQSGSFNNPYVHPASFHTSLHGVEVSAFGPNKPPLHACFLQHERKDHIRLSEKTNRRVGIFLLKFWLPIWKSDFWSMLKNVNPSTAQTSVVCRDLSGNTGCSDGDYLWSGGAFVRAANMTGRGWVVPSQMLIPDIWMRRHREKVSSPWQHSASKLERERYVVDNLEPQLAPICFWAFSKLCVQGQLFSQDNTLLL